MSANAAMPQPICTKAHNEPRAMFGRHDHDDHKQVGDEGCLPRRVIGLFGQRYVRPPTGLATSGRMISHARPRLLTILSARSIIAYS
jgi:hypothetical protein